MKFNHPIFKTLFCAIGVFIISLRSNIGFVLILLFFICWLIGFLIIKPINLILKKQFQTKIYFIQLFIWLFCFISIHFTYQWIIMKIDEEALQIVEKIKNYQQINGHYPPDLETIGEDKYLFFNQRIIYSPENQINKVYFSHQNLVPFDYCTYDFDENVWHCDG